MSTPTTERRDPASFRDPSGRVFWREGVLYRAVAPVYQEEYDSLMNSGLYAALTGAGLMIRHEETTAAPGSYKTIKPQLVPFISYPYEWCFSQLKDAALVTLAIQRRALDFGMALKDASAYNVQFLIGRPVFIDTLSFEKYREGEPWVAYRQFCQHFLAPLALMSKTDIRLSQLLRVYIDGVPLDLAGRLLPSSTRWSFTLGTHIHLHGRAQQHYADKATKPVRRRMSRMAFLGLISSLESAVKRLNWRPVGTEWADYYDETNYGPSAFAAKEKLVGDYLAQVNPGTVWDLGANTGRFSRIAADEGIRTIAFDIDPAAVERNYVDCRRRSEQRVLPLVLDLTNPSPGIGWQNRERSSLIQRGPADAVLALALVHHLAIGNNLPFEQIVEFLAAVGNALIIEFVPKSDSQVQRLLATREDIFPDYTQEAFEAACAVRFRLRAKSRVGDSQRTLYLMTHDA